MLGRGPFGATVLSMNATSSPSERRRPGHRGRIGLIQPAPGVMIEYEWPARLPAEILFPMARLRMTGASSADWDSIAERAPDAARDLASADADVIGFACSVGSLYAGAAFEDALVDRLAAASGKPAFSLGAASVLALQALGAQKIAIITPYPDATNALMSAYMTERGLTPLPVARYPVGIAEIGNLPAGEIAMLSIAALEALPEADALWIPCTAVRTLDAIPAIERATGRPVVSGSQALLWRALRMIGIDDAVAGSGCLFDF